MAESKESENICREIIWAGRLDGGTPDHSVWRGSISAENSVLKERFGLSSSSEVSEKLGWLRDRAAEMYVFGDTFASVRCIDGRGEAGELGRKPDLGPQVPGGAPVMSLAWRVAVGLEPGINIESNLDKFKGLLRENKLPYLPGAHEDESNAEHPENTGCGAIDKMLDILKIMAERDDIDGDERIYRVYEYAKVIGLEYFNNDEKRFNSVFNDILVKLEILNGPRYNERFFQKDENSGHHRFRSGLVHRIREEGHQTGRKTVEKLSGNHNEVFFIVNKFQDEVFDRDGFAGLTDSRAQAFNYDVWHPVARAAALFADDKEKQQTMILHNIMYSVATGMALTDGSIQVGIRG